MRKRTRAAPLFLTSDYYDLPCLRSLPTFLISEASMEVQFLIGVMGTFTVVATYYWVGRESKSGQL